MNPYFVVYVGKIESDPLDRGCEIFYDCNHANAFMYRQKNKGYRVSLFIGKRVGPPVESLYVEESAA